MIDPTDQSWVSAAPVLPEALPAKDKEALHALGVRCCYCDGHVHGIDRETGEYLCRPCFRASFQIALELMLAGRAAR